MRVLIVDDDAAHASDLCRVVSDLGHDVTRHGTVSGALTTSHAVPFSLAFVCMDVGDEDGLSVLSLPGLRQADIVLMNREDDRRRVDRGIAMGAAWFMRKPFEPRFVTELVNDIAAEQRARTRRPALRQQPVSQFALMRGGSEPMRRLFRTMRKVAPLDTSLLIVGESGVGKELVAQSLHLLSARSHRPMVSVNCAAIPRDLFESELFGHERGSFSGAIDRHVGLFEQANGTTLFLDEITEMPVEMQAKLLRVLEVNSFRRVGGEHDLTSDVRILASSNREPDAAIAANRLRRDLYYRLAHMTIVVPPLRERGTDIAGLTLGFLDELNERHEMAKGISDDAMDLITARSWPGNVRELRSAIERAFILSGHDIEVTDLQELRAAPDAERGRIAIPINATIAQAEKTLILAVLDEYGGNKSRAAASLGISLKTLYNRLNEYGGSC